MNIDPNKPNIGEELESRFADALSQIDNLESLKTIKQEAKTLIESSLTLEQRKHILNIINVVNEVIMRKEQESLPASDPLHQFYKSALETSVKHITNANRVEKPDELTNALEATQRIYNTILDQKPPSPTIHEAFEMLYDVSYYGRLSLAANESTTPSAKSNDPYSGLPESQTMNIRRDQISAVQTNPAARFTEGRIIGDGNCGFAATNTTRAEVMHYLLENANDPRIRSTVAPEIQGWLKTSPAKDLPGFANAIMEQYWQNSEDISIIETLARREDLFHCYVTTHYDKGYLILPDPDTTGVINIIAEMKGLQIRVWEPVEGPNHNIRLRAVYGDDQDNAHTMNIILRQIHFNKILPTADEYSSPHKHNPGDIVALSPLKMYA